MLSRTRGELSNIGNLTMAVAYHYDYPNVTLIQDAVIGLFKFKAPCPVAEWLERRAEEHICPHCAGSKPAWDNVIACQRLRERER